MKNILEPERVTRQPSRKRKPQPLVTIVSVLVSKSAMIMASDSRTTSEDERTIRDDTQKIHALRLSDGFSFLVGQSGNDDLGARAVEIMTDMASSTTIGDYRTCAELAQTAVARLKTELREQFKGTSEELQRHFESHNFELLLAHYHKLEKDKLPKPLIFTLKFSLGSARLQQKQFVSIGCGSPIADFISDKFSISQCDWTQTAGIAVYVVEQVKKFDPRCGGRTQIGSTEIMVGHISPAVIIHETLVDDLSKAVDEIGKEISAAQNSKMTEVLEKLKTIMTPRVDKIKAGGKGVHINLDGSLTAFDPESFPPTVEEGEK